MHVCVGRKLQRLNLLQFVSTHTRTIIRYMKVSHVTIIADEALAPPPALTGRLRPLC